MAVWFLNMTHCSFTLYSDDTVMVTPHEIAEHVATGSRTTSILFSLALTSLEEKNIPNQHFLLPIKGKPRTNTCKREGEAA